MYKSFTVWRSPAKIERILCILVKYAYEIDSRIKFNGFLESTKHWIFQGGYTPTVQRQHMIDTYGTSSVGEGLPRLGTRKTSFVEYPTGTAQPPSNSFNPLRKNQ
ncbi:hypothetical protein ALC53_12485 [Atta colombica]|uniref:Uncharacterized protein n=1 Tax=Atta colombica TaxID=520822 RepID=A0A195AYS3_9HYME|nr:hypothetical protein ALC53_12485 [Atta colombica]